MARYERGRAVQFAAQVIRANKLTDAELELQLESLWKSGWQAGRKAMIRAQLVEKGVASIARMRSQAARESNSPLSSVAIGKPAAKS